MTFLEGQQGQSGIIPEVMSTKDPFNLRQDLGSLYKVFTQGEVLSDDDLRTGYNKLRWLGQKAKKGVEVFKTFPTGHLSGDLDAILAEDLVDTALFNGRGRIEEVLGIAETLENYASVMLGEKGEDAWPLAEETRDVSILVRFACEHPDWYEDRGLAGILMELSKFLGNRTKK